MINEITTQVDTTLQVTQSNPAVSQRQRFKSLIFIGSFVILLAGSVLVSKLPEATNTTKEPNNTQSAASNTASMAPSKVVPPHKEWGAVYSEAMDPL